MFRAENASVAVAAFSFPTLQESNLPLATPRGFPTSSSDAKAKESIQRSASQYKPFLDTVHETIQAVFTDRVRVGITSYCENYFKPEQQNQHIQNYIKIYISKYCRPVNASDFLIRLNLNNAEIANLPKPSVLDCFHTINQTLVKTNDDLKVNIGRSTVRRMAQYCLQCIAAHCAASNLNVSKSLEEICLVVLKTPELVKNNFGPIDQLSWLQINDAPEEQGGRVFSMRMSSDDEAMTRNILQNIMAAEKDLEVMVPLEIQPDPSATLSTELTPLSPVAGLVQNQSASGPNT